MRKALLTLIAIMVAASIAMAYTDSYMPKSHRLGEKYAFTNQNYFFAHSGDRNTTLDAYQPITGFNYETDGKWAYALGHSEIWGNNEPAVTFGGGNDVANTVNVWFWSPSAGLRVINEEPYVGRQSFWTSVSKADDGTLYVIWANTHTAEASGTIFASKSTDNGVTWSPKVDVGALVKAHDPIDTAMYYPKLAPRAIDGLHMIWLDDHKNPGSAIQGTGSYDTCFVKYAKINFAFDAVLGLDNGVNSPDSDRVVTLGWTSYDWATTGPTQGCVIDDNQNMCAVWTDGNTVPYSTRFIGNNSYMTAAGVGTPALISPATAGFPGIALATGGANGQIPLIVYHRSSAIRAVLDQGGIGGGMMTSEAVFNSGANYIWPSCAHIGGTNIGDSVAAVGNQGSSYIGVRMYFSPDNFSTVSTTDMDGAAFDQGTGTYDGIVASPNSPDMWMFFNGQVTTNAAPWAPTLYDTTHYPTSDSLGLYWSKTAYTNDGTDQWKVYHKLNVGGTWAEIASIDSAGAPATIVYVVGNSSTTADTNYYYITSHDVDGVSASSNIITECLGVIVTGVTGNPSKPTIHNFSLSQNMPNPARSTTKFSFNMPKAGAYKLNVYNLMGQLVKNFSGNGNAGGNTINWNLKSDNGAKIANGLYFYQLQAGSNKATKKLVVVQ